MMTRSPLQQPEIPSCSTTLPNRTAEWRGSGLAAVRRACLDGGGRGRIRVVAVEVSQQTDQLLERRRIEPAVFPNAVACEL
jgi:hypothetical protein